MTYSLIPAWCTRAIAPPALREWELSRCKGNNPEAGRRLRSDAVILMALLMSLALVVNGMLVVASKKVERTAREGSVAWL
jgi:hypothetical protein